MSVYISFVLDETGSMVSCKQDTITGFNEYIKDLRGEFDGEDIKFSLMKFNSNKKNWLFLDAGLSDIPELTNVNYLPSDWTPLWDAFGLALENMATKELNEDDIVLIVVLTDGHENASMTYDAEKVKSMIDEHPNWKVVCLGADIDAWGVGMQIGISQGDTYTYDKTMTGGTFRGMSNATIAYVHGGGMSGGGGGGSFFAGMEEETKTTGGGGVEKDE